ncbi:hypothetical protein M0805_006116 [Coniferiporia weirii]|nr:hypothetical protein M0805_006116 [Coniferiporia weirii]
MEPVDPLVSPTRPLFHFPRTESRGHIYAHPSSQSLVRLRNDHSTLSLSSRVSLPTRVTALEVYDLMYGDAPTADPAEAVERLYEASAGAYENPLITASSRQIIADINTLTRQLRELDVPRPLAMFKTLFRPHAPGEVTQPWFQALRVWSDIEDICDSESFDGHRTSIIEHTLNILFLPGLHSDSPGAECQCPDADSSSVISLPSLGTTAKPALAIPGLRGLSIPSPLHLQMHVVTRLSLNEQGKITRHRDLWDVRDVLGLVPGMHAAQWIGTRAAAHGLSWATHLAGWLFGHRKDSQLSDDSVDVERGAASFPLPLGGTAGEGGGANALGLHLEGGGPRSHRRVCSGGGLYAFPRRESVVSHAPDVDRNGDT